MELFGKMELNTYLCRAKKERDGLRHQRYITQTGYRTLPEFAKKETLRIIPQQFQARQHDTVQLTYPKLPVNWHINSLSYYRNNHSLTGTGNSSQLFEVYLFRSSGSTITFIICLIFI